MLVIPMHMFNQVVVGTLEDLIILEISAYIHQHTQITAHLIDILELDMVTIIYIIVDLPFYNLKVTID